MTLVALLIAVYLLYTKGYISKFTKGVV